MRIVSATLYAADGTTAIQSLAAASEMQWLDELYDAGSFSFRIPIEYAPSITIGQIVKFAFGPSSADYVWAGVIENIRVNQVGAGSDGVAREYEISGRGVRALLEDAIVYNSGANASRTFGTVSAGSIMSTLIDEAQSRGAISEITYDFDAALDSDGIAFAETLQMEESVGTSLYAVAAKHQELAVDLWVTPSLVLKYVNERGTDNSTGAASVVLRVGQNVGELAQESGGPVRNTVLVASGADGTTFTTASDAGSQASYGRRETYLSLASTTDAGVITLASNHVLNNSAQPTDGTTVQLSDTGALPYVDFNPGDTISLARLDGSRTAYKVRSITVSLGADGMVSFVPELGSAKPDLTRRLATALQKLERNAAGGESDSATSGGISGLGGGGSAGVLFENGTVLTYDPVTETGTFDFDGTTYDFDNATGFGLDVGDTITTTSVDGVTNKVAMGVYDRVGSYTPIVLNNPQAVAGFPFDGDQLPNQFNYCFDFSGLTSGVTPGGIGAPPAAWYGSGVLGFAGRVVVYLSRGINTTAQPTIVFYNVETGASTAINRTAAVSATNRSHSVGVIGTRLFLTYDGTTGNCVESYNSSTGVWSTHDIQAAVYLGVSDSRAWWVGKVSGAANPTRWKVISIDSSGTLSSIDNPANVTAGTQIFGRAKNGKLFFRINNAGALLYVANTNVAAASITFSNNTTAPTTLPYTTTGAAASVGFASGQKTYAWSDIDSSGNCYFLVRTGTPTTAGFAKINPTTLAVTTYTQLTSSTGSAADGEILIIGGLALVGSQVVLFGGIREDLVSGGSNTGSVMPAYWRTDGVTTTRFDDTEYVGLLGSAGGATIGYCRTAPIHQDTVTSTFYFHTNIASVGAPGATFDGVKTTGPAYGEAFTV